jgi:rhamnosyltransferase
MFRVAVIIPTLNGGERFRQLLVSLSKQIFPVERKIVIDSQSIDNTTELAKQYGYEVVSIPRNEFNHGLTRQQGVEMVTDVDVVVFLTQDTILVDDMALSCLVACFDNDTVGAAYGRQLPHLDATPAESFARLFNYSAESRLKSIESRFSLGIKAAFISNSFAAYRRSALMKTGGFPTNVILGEDMYVAAKMLLNQWKIAYCAEAQVYHSHHYNLIQEFKRYFDTGTFHSKEPWILEQFGKAEGEGLRYVRSELIYLWNSDNKALIPSALIRTIMKFFGYKLGTFENKLPGSLKKQLSMHYKYWQASSE